MSPALHSSAYEPRSALVFTFYHYIIVCYDTITVARSCLSLRLDLLLHNQEYRHNYELTE